MEPNAGGLTRSRHAIWKAWVTPFFLNYLLIAQLRRALSNGVRYFWYLGWTCKIDLT